MLIKFMFAFSWAVIILLIMCTSDAQAFLFDLKLHYTFNLTPEFSELLTISDIGLNDSFYLIQKAGHILSFGVLYILVLNWLNKPSKSLAVCVAFALFSELLQLFFQRNGRFFDIGVDLIGVFLAYCICAGIKKQRKIAVGK